MARTATSLLVAIAFAAAPFTAQALGVTKCGDCPAKSFEEVGDTFILPVGECGDKQETGCAGYFTCEISEWEFVAEPPSCEGTEYDCEVVQKGKWIEPLAGECCGTCCFGTPEDCDFSLP